MKGDSEGSGYPVRAGLATLAAIGALALALPGVAAAAAPKATTGPARQVSYGSAAVTGTVDPGGAGTSFYFQYGPTRAYGGQSAIGSAGAGTKGVDVAVPLAGLQPLTVYHYRLVAVNGAGTALGGDRTFQTTKVPLSLSILAAPDPVLYGAPLVIQGTLSGTLNAGRQVILEGRPFPFAAPFAPIGNPELTTAAGSFSFTLLGAATSMQFQVVTTTKPVVASLIATESVAVRVSSHIARTRRHGFVRVYGTVTPAEDGAQVGILRIVHGHGVLVGGTVLRHHDPATSTFSRVVHVQKGVYRVLVKVAATSAQVSNYGEPLLIR
ncbi:MAG TPA: hypothetical protein VNV44_01275 [Solirubrobacteraceae bacterium]|nr:hypothetical protein [Solirubrobacteraceae bacterium]